MTDAVGLLIGGDRIVTGSMHAHVYPGTGSVNATVALAGPDEIDRAVTAGSEAQRQWMARTVDQRRDALIDLADVVHDHLGELAELNTRDYVFPISFAGNAVLLEQFLRHFAGYVDKPHGSSTPGRWRNDRASC